MGKQKYEHSDWFLLCMNLLKLLLVKGSIVQEFLKTVSGYPEAQVTAQWDGKLILAEKEYYKRHRSQPSLTNLLRFYICL